LPDPAILPVRVALDGGRPAITCLDVGDATFAEPFFRQTIELARDSTPMVIPYDDFRAALSSSCQPAGFIFHMSRCGSTLVSQLLKEIAGVRVYSEPEPINQALSLTSRLRFRESRDLLEALIRAFCRSSSRVFFKLTSWNVLHYSLFDELFPDVPKLFVVRRPIEVLASIAKAPPGFVVNREKFAEVVRRRAGDRSGPLGDLEAAAVLLSVYLDTMAAPVNGGSARVLDYTDLPTAVWRMLPSFFGIAQDEIDVARMKGVARFYSKSYPARVPFRKKDESSRAGDRALLERYVTTWIESRYDDLTKTRLNMLRGAIRSVRKPTPSKPSLCSGEVPSP
jgi:hypothetical protein